MYWKDRKKGSHIVSNGLLCTQEGQAPPAKSQVAVGPFTVKPTWGDLTKIGGPRYPAAYKQNIRKWYWNDIMVISRHITSTKTLTCIASTWSFVHRRILKFIHAANGLSLKIDIPSCSYDTALLAKGSRLQPHHNLIPHSTGKTRIFLYVDVYISFILTIHLVERNNIFVSCMTYHFWGLVSWIRMKMYRCKSPSRPINRGIHRCLLKKRDQPSSFNMFQLFSLHYVWPGGFCTCSFSVICAFCSFF